MAAQAVTLFIGRRTCSSSGGGTGRTMKKPNIMGNEEPNERSRNGDALPVRIRWEIVERERPIVHNQTGHGYPWMLACHGVMSKINCYKNVSEHILLNRGTFLRLYLQNLRSPSDPNCGQETGEISIENYLQGR